jgi:hypothetical protein
MKRTILVCGTVVLAWCVAGFAGDVDSKAARPESNGVARPESAKGVAKTPKSDKNLPAFTPEREAAALALVREHHPEVAELLDRLKSNRPAQYRRAVRELAQTSQRLAQWKERDPARYELELKLWKTQSRIQLLSARASMSGDLAQESELRQALSEQMDVRIALLKLQRDAAARRVQDLESQIARLSSHRDAAVQRQLNRAKQAIENQRKKKKGGKPSGGGQS